MRINTGAPIMEVMIPIGNSAGGMITRAQISQTSISPAPSKAEAGIKNL
jgi:peptidase E